MAECIVGTNGNTTDVSIIENQLQNCGLFNFGQRLGMSFTVEGGILSILSVSTILVLAGYRRLSQAITRLREGENSRRHSDAADSSLFIALMVADLIHAIGFLPNTQWIHDARITEGSLCTAQAVIKQIGLVGIAMMSLAIAIHTTAVLSLGWREPKGYLTMANALIIAATLATLLITVVPLAQHAKGSPLYGNAGFWCWILSNKERLVAGYVWMWLTAGLLVILYTANFLSMRGGMRVFSAKHVSSKTEEDRRAEEIANSLLFFPAVYILNILPNSVVRWIQFNGGTTPYQATLFANTIFSLSGTFNLILFLWTRPNVVIPPADSESIPEYHQHAPPAPQDDQGSVHSDAASNVSPMNRASYVGEHEMVRRTTGGGLPARKPFLREEEETDGYPDYPRWSAGIHYQGKEEGSSGGKRTVTDGFV